MPMEGHAAICHVIVPCIIYSVQKCNGEQVIYVTGVDCPSHMGIWGYAPRIFF